MLEVFIDFISDLIKKKEHRLARPFNLSLNYIDDVLSLNIPTLAPVKTLKLPQLELIAALIGACSAQHMKETVEMKRITYWSDSQIVLQWLNSIKQMKRFVKNRIDEIKTLTNNLR